MRFKVGDKVRVREDLDKASPYGRYAGATVTVKRTLSWAGAYVVEGIELWFTDEMLEPIEDPLATKIEERNNKHTDDKVNSPSHYTRGDVEVIDIIKQLTQGYEPFEAYLVGNTIKYLARANFKENKQQDLEKAEWHIDKLLEEQNK